jgi:hypothetical protein
MLGLSKSSPGRGGGPHEVRWRGLSTRTIGLKTPFTTPLRVAMGRFGSLRDPKPCRGDRATSPSLPIPGRI